MQHTTSVFARQLPSKTFDVHIKLNEKQAKVINLVCACKVITGKQVMDYTNALNIVRQLRQTQDRYRKVYNNHNNDAYISSSLFELDCHLESAKMGMVDQIPTMAEAEQILVSK